MKKWINTIFGSNKEDDVRKLEQPGDLQIGDIIKFRYLPQPELSNQEFQVKTINTYDFEDRNLTEFVLQGTYPENLYMTVDDTDDEPFLAISRKINRDVVEKIFDLDQFALLFDDESHNQLSPQATPDELKSWVAHSYIQEIFAEGGYFLKGDYRNRTIPQDSSSGEFFEYYLAIDDSRQWVVEAEVYDEGETDVLLTIRRPLSDIDEMWPSANG